MTLFSRTDGAAPALPHLDVLDNTSQTSVSVGGVTGADSDFIQSVAVQYNPLEWLSEEAVYSAAPDWGEMYFCRRLSKVLVRFRFSQAGESCVFRPVWRDANYVQYVGPQTTVNATPITDGGEYIGEVAVFDTYGANDVRLYIETSPSVGTLKARLAGI